MSHVFNVFVRSKGVAGHPSANYLYTNLSEALKFARETVERHAAMIVSIVILKQCVHSGAETDLDDFGRAKEKRQTETVFLTTWPERPGDPWTEKFSDEFEALIKESVEEVTA